MGVVEVDADADVGWGIKYVLCVGFTVTVHLHFLTYLEIQQNSTNAECAAVLLMGSYAGGGSGEEKRRVEWNGSIEVPIPHLMSTRRCAM